MFLRLVKGNAEEAGGMEYVTKDDEVPVVPPHGVLLAPQAGRQDRHA